ncbi:MAG TPA: hypothetical protein VKE91_03285, partial [Blastocatellia bacterium]|nr:hypothetical protein [Blastocatellia bacterium]
TIQESLADARRCSRKYQSEIDCEADQIRSREDSDENQDCNETFFASCFEYVVRNDDHPCSRQKHSQIMDPPYPALFPIIHQPPADHPYITNLAEQLESA